MNSVSKINVQIGSNAAQFAAGMGQASSAVGRFTASAGQMNMAVSQLAFAADDVVQVYGQSGVAGALRAASNNISMMAASLFGVKGLMIAVAASAATQLALSFNKARDEAAEATAATAAFREELEAVSRTVPRNAAVRPQLREIAGLSKVGDAFREQNRGRNALQDMLSERRDAEAVLKDLRAKLAAERAWLDDPRRHMGLNESEPNEIIEARIKSIADEIAEREKALRTLQEEIVDQKRLNVAVGEQVRLLQQRRIAAPDTGAAAGIGRRLGVMAEAQGLDAEIKALQEDMRASMSVSEMFSRFPGINAFGSSGAISAINVAQFGPQNARDAGVMVQRQSLQELRRIRELEEKKKGLLEVVGL